MEQKTIDYTPFGSYTRICMGCDIKKGDIDRSTNTLYQRIWCEKCQKQ